MGFNYSRRNARKGQGQRNDRGSLTEVVLEPDESLVV